MIEFKCPYPGCEAVLKLKEWPEQPQVFSCKCKQQTLLIHKDSVKMIKPSDLGVTLNKGAKDESFEKDKYVRLGEIYPEDNKWATVEVIVYGRRVPDEDDPRKTRSPKASERFWQVMLWLPAAFDSRRLLLPPANMTKAEARRLAKEMLSKPQEAVLYLASMMLRNMPEQFEKLFDYGFLKEVGA